MGVGQVLAVIGDHLPFIAAHSAAGILGAAQLVAGQNNSS
jgi:hypothetical protein